jgi:hypothetical protein
MVQFDINVVPWFNRQSEETVLYLEPVAGGQHQLPSMWNPCPRVLLPIFPIVAKNPSGYTDSSESIIAERVTAETMIRPQRESLETGNVLLYSNGDADVHHASELLQ